MSEAEQDTRPRYLCGGCWARFGPWELIEVAERVGRGFRCLKCFREKGASTGAASTQGECAETRGEG